MLESSNTLESSCCATKPPRPPAGVRLDSLEAQAQYAANPRLKAVEEALAQLEQKMEAVTAGDEVVKEAVGGSAAVSEVVSETLAARVVALEAAVGVTQRELEAVTASAMREASSLRAALDAAVAEHFSSPGRAVSKSGSVGARGAAGGVVSVDEAAGHDGAAEGGEELASGGEDEVSKGGLVSLPGAATAATAAAVTELRAGQEALADRLAELEARLAAEEVASPRTGALPLIPLSPGASEPGSVPKAVGGGAGASGVWSPASGAAGLLPPSFMNLKRMSMAGACAQAGMCMRW